MKLLDYIRGLRKGKEAHRLEKESMKDPFLADAMDGYHQVKGNHDQQIRKLQAQVSAHSAKKKNSYAITWSVAACLVIGIGISSYFLFLKKNIGEEVFIVQKNSFPTIQKSDSDSVQMTTNRPTDKNVKIAKVKKRARLITQTDHIIKGKVTDKNGEPLIGAYVIYEANDSTKKTDIRAITDPKGEFSLLKKKGDGELTVNYIGYDPVKMPVDTNQVILIAMNESSQLDEIVVVGCGIQKKMNVTGSVSTVSQKDLKESLPKPIIGMRQYKKYLKKNLIRPIDETCAKTHGKVILTFLVNKERRPYDIEVKKSLCESSDKEAIRLIQEGPDWTYGTRPMEITVVF